MSMTVGRVEFAPNYGRWLDAASPTGKRQLPMEVKPEWISGKSPLDRHIGEPAEESGDNTFVRKRNDPIVRHPLSDPWEQWHQPPLTASNDNHPLPKVVALTGLAGSGKSTLADYLIARHGYVRVKFAGPLKSMMRAIGLSDAHIEGDLKEVPCPLLQGKTPRYAMQTIGSEWGRDIMGKDFWTGLWADVANDVLDNGGRVVCDDCRFENEADTVRRYGGVIVQLQGRGGIAGKHQSEAGVDADVVLHNVGTIEDLRRSADEVLFGWRN